VIKKVQMYILCCTVFITALYCFKYSDLCILFVSIRLCVYFYPLWLKNCQLVLLHHHVLLHVHAVHIRWPNDFWQITLPYHNVPRVIRRSIFMQCFHLLHVLHDTDSISYSKVVLVRSLRLMLPVGSAPQVKGSTFPARIPSISG